jgi:hypothetical protein
MKTFRERMKIFPFDHPHSIIMWWIIFLIECVGSSLHTNVYSFTPFYSSSLPRRGAAFQAFNLSRKRMWCVPSLTIAALYLMDVFTFPMNTKMKWTRAEFLKILDGVVKVKFTDTFTQQFLASWKIVQASITTLMYSWE